MQESIGGSYSEVREANKRTNKEHKTKNGTHKYEAHEVIARASFQHSNLNIRRTDIPATAMSKENHRLTKNWGTGKNNKAKKYRQEQTKLLNQGKFKQAWDKGIADVRSANKKSGVPENITNQGILKAEKQWLKLDKSKQLNLGKDFREDLNRKQLENKDSTLAQNQEKPKASTNSNSFAMLNVKIQPTNTFKENIRRSHKGFIKKAIQLEYFK